MQTCFPLDKQKYFAKDMRMWHIGRTSGVINATGHDYETHAGIGMQTVVGPGYAYVQTGTAELGGAMHSSDENETFTHSPADPILDRIDSIIIRYDGLNNTCQLMKIEGNPESSPKPYKPVRNSNIYELVLQYVRVNHGISAITDSMIKSQILNEEVCGIAIDSLAKIPTDQYDAQMKSWINESQTEFMNWFNKIKGQLSTDQAGNLQVQINALEPSVRDSEERLENLAPTNLLVNGDFQCWQRGEELKVDANKYGADMWMCSTNCTIKKVANGLLIVSGTNVTLSQKIKTDELVGKTLMFSKSVNGVVESKVIQISSNLTEIKIEGLKRGDVANYADLHLGSIVYPHVKEDYGFALSRCLPYIQSINSVLNIGYRNVTSTNGHIRFEVPFKTIPTVVIKSAKCIRVADWKTLSNLSYSVQSQSTLNLVIVFRHSVDSDLNRYADCTGVATCEPL